MIRVGLVGFGMAGRVFHGPLISSVDGLTLAAVVERNSDNATCRYPGITTYRSLDAMLADASLDLFVVATPSGTHFQAARQILEAGKNLVVDKPMSTTSAEIAELIALARAKNLLLVPFHNRRWDGDFLTLQKLLQDKSLGNLVFFESRFDRWRPFPPTDRLWKEDASQGGGVLLDLGTHLADQVLALFGKPMAISADVSMERPWASVNDAFSVRMQYPKFTAVLGATCLSLPPGPRYYLRGDKGNFVKHGLDPQEAVLNQVSRITSANWGEEDTAAWGSLHLDVDGSTITTPAPTLTGNYRRYYEGVRDAMLGKSPAPVTARDAWRAVRLLEYAQQSATERREIVCKWEEEPQA